MVFLICNCHDLKRKMIIGLWNDNQCTTATGRPGEINAKWYVLMIFWYNLAIRKEKCLPISHLDNR